MSKLLYEFKNLFSDYANSHGDDGCDTCGYGATPLMSKSDYEKLLKDIDEWIKREFPKPSAKR